jgi:4'-phosphopantetheinyl transferase
MRMAGNASDGFWKSPPERLWLADGGVHLWRIDLGRSLPPDYGKGVSLGELERARRFRFDLDRHQYLLSAYALREILSRYVGIAQGDIPIRSTEKGKPYLRVEDVGQSIFFSLSHAANRAMVAVARARVGVDVEEAVDDYPHMDVAEAYFAEGEAEALRGKKDPGERGKLFFSYWTRKEALLKATGEGLYRDLREIDLSRAGSTKEAPIGYGGGDWAIVELEPDGKLFCSLAVEGSVRNIERYEWGPRNKG